MSFRPETSNVTMPLDAYIEASGISADPKGPLFRTAAGRTGG